MKKLSPKGLLAGPLARLGERLKRTREDAGLSQRQLADAAGVYLSIVYKIEQGNNPNPQVASLAALAFALDVSVDELIGRRPTLSQDSDEPPPGRRGLRQRRA
jgi:transcriptional regulator with XRE-family HTH domain